MKKILIFIAIILSVFSFSNLKAASLPGKGNITLSDEVIENLIRFLKDEFAIYFIVSPDGNYSTFGRCTTTRCKGGIRTVKKWCKDDTGVKCQLFAERNKEWEKVIRWNNVDYIFPKGTISKAFTGYARNPPEPDNTGLREDISDQDILNILSDLGFIPLDNKSGTSNIVKKEDDTKKIIKLDSGKNYVCVWKGTMDEKNYFIYFSSKKKDYERYKKSLAEAELYSTKIYPKLDDCRKGVYYSYDTKPEAVYVFTEDQNKKLYRKVMNLIKNERSMKEKTFAKIEAEIPKYQVDTAQINNNEEETTKTTADENITNENDIIYVACMTNVLSDSERKVKINELYGFHYIKIDPNLSEITVHEDLGDEPFQIIKQKINFIGEESVKLKGSDRGSTDKYIITSKSGFYKDQGYENYSFVGDISYKDSGKKVKIKFKSQNCIPPKDPNKEKKIYDKWLVKGFE